MKNLTLYHGTDTYFTEFDNAFLSTKESVDQYGSGFYFFGNKESTAAYGNLTVTATVNVNKIIKWDNVDNILLNREDVYEMILWAPDLITKLWDHGDIEYDGFDAVLDMAVSAYTGMSIIDGLNCIGNDFYQGEDTYLLLDKFIDRTGIDCVYDDTTDIYVVLSKNNIKIKSVDEIK